MRFPTGSGSLEAYERIAPKDPADYNARMTPPIRFDSLLDDLVGDTTEHIPRTVSADVPPDRGFLGTPP